jgi:hypothetical protein
LSRIDPWSAAKVAFVMSVGIALAIIVAVVLLWILFNVVGVFDSVGRTIGDVVGGSFNTSSLFGFGRVVGLSFVVAVVQVILTTAFVTLLASLYNLAAYFVGGLQLVLTED